MAYIREFNGNKIMVNLRFDGTHTHKYVKTTW